MAVGKSAILPEVKMCVMGCPKGGLGAQPQGFDFVSLPEGHHVQKSMLAHMGQSPQGFGFCPKGMMSVSSMATR
ncbi:MAG: hypothetical protein HW380_3487 [Magnetococcales bacterium]|nr:hypothetical protein [Magnetococcales bacterium]